jgi:acyl-CoA thioesterase FadM
VTYRVPTPLQTDLRFEVWLERVEGRKHFLAGHALLGEQVTASVKSVFVALDHELVRSMFLPEGT